MQNNGHYFTLFLMNNVCNVIIMQPISCILMHYFPHNALKCIDFQRIIENFTIISLQFIIMHEKVAKKCVTMHWTGGDFQLIETHFFSQTCHAL